MAYRVYRLECLDPSVTDCYIGFTSMSDEDFWLCKDHKYRDKTSGEIMDGREPDNFLQAFIRANGGVDGWECVILVDDIPTRAAADVEKHRLHLADPDLYTLNGSPRAPRGTSVATPGRLEVRKIT